MMEKTHTFAELALGVGRFEMQPLPNQGDMHWDSLIRLSQAEALGLFQAAEIRACSLVEKSARQHEILDALGSVSGKHWILRPPATDQQAKQWDRLLKSDQVLVFVAPLHPEWLSTLIRQLHSPFVAMFPSMSLTEDWLRYERKAFKGVNNGVHVSLGAGRATVTFVGTGELFSSAVSCASERPPMMWGYPTPAFRDTLRSRKLIFPKSATAPEE